MKDLNFISERSQTKTRTKIRSTKCKFHFYKILENVNKSVKKEIIDCLRMGKGESGSKGGITKW